MSINEHDTLIDLLNEFEYTCSVDGKLYTSCICEYYIVLKNFLNDFDDKDLKNDFKKRIERLKQLCDRGEIQSLDINSFYYYPNSKSQTSAVSAPTLAPEVELSGALNAFSNKHVLMAAFLF